MDGTMGHARPRFPQDPPPLGELVRGLSSDAATLVRQEIALAKLEMKNQARSVARNVARVAVGVVIAALGLLVLVTAIIALLAKAVGSATLATLAVGVLMLALGGFLAWRAVKGLQGDRIAPEATLATVRETTAWAKGEAAHLRHTLAYRPEDAGRANGNGRANGAANGLSSSRISPLAAGDDARTAYPPLNRATATERAGSASSSSDAPAAAAPGKKNRLPLSVPLWKRVMKEFSDDDLSNEAAKVTYYFFMSLPPLLMALFGLAGLLGGQGTADWLVEKLSTSLPGEASALVSQFVAEVVHENAPGPFSIGLLLALWAASNVFMSLEDTLNRAFEITEKRGFVKKRLVALSVLGLCSVLFLGGSTALLAGPAISDALGLGAVGRTAWGIAQWPLAFALISAAFWVIYYVLPNQDQKGCRKVLAKAAAISAGLWVLATLAFRVYVSNFGSYSKTYGFLGGFIVLLLWLYVTSLVILLGGEVASEMERES